MVGIIILNYNTSQDVIKCINSIEKTTQIEQRFFIVDNCSTDNSQEIISDEYCNNNKVTLIYAEKNLGYSGGNNLGIKEALKQNCQYILLTNPDVIFYNRSIDIMVEALIKDTEIGVVGPKIIQKDGSIFKYKKNKPLTYSQYIFERKPFKWIDFLKLRTLHDKKYEFDKTVKFFGAISGCCFCLPAQVFKKIGLYDEKVFLYYEEDILATKLKMINLKSCIVPAAEVLHFHSGSIGDVGAPFVRMHIELSALYFLRAYRGVGGLRFTLAKKLAIFVFSWVAKKHNQDISYIKRLRDGIEQIQKIKPKSAIRHKK